jgi:tetratricopeptide (TPR) repeat protein
MISRRATLFLVAILTCLDRHEMTLVAELPAAPSPTAIHAVASPRVELHFTTASEAAPLTRVDLWVTSDGGKTWLSAGPQLPKSPAVFETDRDGLYGFILIATNEAGASSPPPAPGTPPNKWVRVDRAAPLVQALSIRPDARFAENRLVRLRWRAQDDDLEDNAVAIHYRTAQTGVYRLLIDHLPAEGTHDWRVPAELAGRVDFKFTALDRAGNLGSVVVDTLHVDPGHDRSIEHSADRPAMRGRAIDARSDDLAEMSLEGDPSTPAGAGPTVTSQPVASFRMAGHAEPDAGETAHALASSREARRRYEVGTWHRLRGEYALAAARYREALELDGDLHAARCDLGGVYLLQGDLESARRELEAVTTADPAHLPALKGLSLVHTRMKNYRSARTVLDKVLLLAPGDADAWMAFGDVLLFIGDRPAARKAWARIETLETSADVKARARKRLDLYPAVSGE